jgi:2-oxoglutarate dehydrogenase complex dehydrogenase (E1) component-like enzyme
VANVTTAAQLFHVLRRQVYGASAKPLILFTPKRYLRGREAYSPVGELSYGAFREVVDDQPVHPGRVRRVVLASGKFGLDLLVAREEARRADVAIVRVEQLYPWPRQQIEAVISAYPSVTEVVWAQEEPANMGAWEFVRDRLGDIVNGRQSLVSVARAASASPATGSHTLHDLEQADILQRALTPGS